VPSLALQLSELACEPVTVALAGLQPVGKRDWENLEADIIPFRGGRTAQRARTTIHHAPTMLWEDQL
jgi:hypothetical protein